MALADDLLALQFSAVNDLNAAHDYYADTKAAWNIVHQVVKAGYQFAVRNKTTGTITGQFELAYKARGYVSEQLVETTFQQFVSIFEITFSEFLTLWLAAYPQNLNNKKVDFKDVLEAPDLNALKLLVVRKEVNDVLYDRPTGWFAYLEDRAKLGCPSGDEIDRIAEAKATRDVLVHNRGMANKAYEAKAGRLARYKAGEKMEIPEHYHRETWILIRKVIADIATAAIKKLS